MAQPPVTRYSVAVDATAFVQLQASCTGKNTTANKTRKLMKDNKTIHALARPGSKSGKIRFIHTDGKEHCYYSVVNDLTGSRLSGFDSDAPTIDNTLNEVSVIFRNIRNKAKVVESIGDF